MTNMRISHRMKDLGLELPPAQVAKIARIEGAVRFGDLLFLSGALPKWGAEIKYIGKAGREFALEEAREAARLSALNLIAQARQSLDGDLDRIQKILKVTGFVNAVPSFTLIPEVVNGASELFIDVFGDAGRHARTAVGVAVMPFDALIEVEAVMGVR